MKIAIIGPYPLSVSDFAIPAAPANFAYNLSSELVKRSNDVMVFTLGGYGFQGRGLLIRVGETCRSNKVSFLQFAKELRRGSFDIVSLQDFSPLNFMWLATAYKKLAFSPRGLVSRGTKLGCTYAKWEFLNERISMKARVVITQSDIHREAAVTDYKVPRSRVKVIPNGVNSIFLKSETQETIAPQSKGAILFVGTIGPWKGVDLLLESIDLLRRKSNSRFPNVILIGSSTYGHIHSEWLPYLRRRFRYLFNERVALHLPPQPQNIIKQFYKEASMLVLPSRFDAFGNVALEAMACGTPVILSDKTGVSGLIQNGTEGFVIKNGDISTLADRISLLLSHDDERRRMGDSARRTALKYTWERTASSYEQIFESILGA